MWKVEKTMGVSQSKGRVRTAKYQRSPSHRLTFRPTPTFFSDIPDKRMKVTANDRINPLQFDTLNRVITPVNIVLKSSTCSPRTLPKAMSITPPDRKRRG